MVYRGHNQGAQGTERLTLGDLAYAYRQLGECLQPKRLDKDAVVRAFSFAIVSAHTPFHEAIQAWQTLNAIDWHEWPLWERDAVAGACERLNERANKAAALIELTGKVAERPAGYYLRGRHESWQSYRERVRREVQGLGRAKASFAVCLLYPTTADICCLDTHMQQLLGRVEGKDWSARPCTVHRRSYEHLEAQVRRWGKRYGLPAFLAQWVLWDLKRGKTEMHDALWGLGCV